MRKVENLKGRIQKGLRTIIVDVTLVKWECGHGEMFGLRGMWGSIESFILKWTLFGPMDVFFYWYSGRAEWRDR